MRLLCVNCKSGKLNITSIKCDIDPSLDEGNFRYFDSFPELFDQTFEDDSSQNDVAVLGYVAFSVGKKLKCSSCICRLSKPNDMSCHMPDDVSQYLQ